MAAYVNNDGNQSITFRYLQEAVSEDFNELFRDILRPGVYEGGILTKIDDTTVEIEPYTAILYASNKDDVAIRVRTEEEYAVSISSAKPYIVLRYQWFNSEVNYVEAISRSSGDIGSEDPSGDLYVILGKAEFTGSVLTGFDYSERKFISQDADTIFLGETYSVNSQPTGGTISQFNGETTTLTTIINDIYNRLIDLSGVSNSAVKNRHVDKTTANGIHGGNLISGNPVDFEGSSPGTHSNQTTITFILQSIYNKLKDLSGANNNSVLRRHLNFGIGSSQISLKDFVLGLGGNKTVDGNFTNISYQEGDSLNSLFTKVLDSLNQLASQININAQTLASHNSRISSLENEFRFENLPVGTLLLWDKPGWVDNQTIPGFYACIGSANGTPDMRNLFLKASANPSFHSSDGLENTSGSNSIQLDSSHLPRHTHDFTFNSGKGTARSAGSHSHSYDTDTGSSQRGSGGSSARNNRRSSATTTSAGAHTHVVDVTSISANIEESGVANISPITINPRNYSVIVVKKLH